MIPHSHGSLKQATTVSAPYRDPGAASPGPLRKPLGRSMLVGAVPLALAAKRRTDVLRQQDSDDLDVEESIALLRSSNPDLIDHLARSIGEELDGVVTVQEGSLVPAAGGPRPTAVICDLGPSANGHRVAFAREGGQLAIPASWSGDDVAANVVSLHDGKLLFARSEAELLRCLATRSLRQCVVLYLGPAHTLDDELSACSITLKPFLSDRNTTSSSVAKRLQRHPCRPTFVWSSYEQIPKY